MIKLKEAVGRIEGGGYGKADEGRIIDGQSMIIFFFL
jgi:hypothetical protein